MKASLKFLVVPLAVGALFFAGCGGDDSSDDNSSSDTATTQSQPADNSMGSGQVLNLAADPSGQLAYDKTELSAKAGKVTLDFTNESPIGHNVVIEDSSGKEIASTDTITGQSTTAEFKIKPGTYTFYCSIPGHEQAGMKGTLTVQ
ncbi:MAG: cupredoxin domain-containing protein [Solirubrobacterales bacterium]|nr:cupredoxin domain-containing protein [Solirubrobacterales bacterium]MCB0861528.1 cupredoxin domain-containing protein [Solirubrobacterales bacterium]